MAGTQDPNWSLRIDPVDRPEFVPEPIDLDAAILRALSARTDLAQAKKTLQANDTTFKFLRNQTLPQADLVARYGLAGIGGQKFQRVSGRQPAVVSTIPGGLGDAVTSLFANNYPQWSVQLNFSVPIGYNVASTAVAQAKLQMNQTAAQVSQIELQIATDVTNAVTNLQSDVEAVQAAQAALDLAQQTYEAEQAKLDVGLSTNYNVILDLNALNTVKNSYLQAVLNYRNALVELDRLQQTTLQNLNVTLPDDRHADRTGARRQRTLRKRIITKARRARKRFFLGSAAGWMISRRRGRCRPAHSGSVRSACCVRPGPV